VRKQRKRISSPQPGSKFFRAFCLFWGIPAATVVVIEEKIRFPLADIPEKVYTYGEKIGFSRRRMHYASS
jgi:hypothetical protein